MTNLAGDVRGGLRALIRDRSTFVPLLLVLVVGLGAATTIFTIADGVYLRSLPFRDAHRVVVIWQSDPTQPYSSRTPVSAPNFRDWQASARAFDDLAAVTMPRGMTLVGGDDPQRVRVSGVTPNTFDLLGTAPALGRFFASASETSLLVSHRVWQTTFRGGRDALGQPVTLDGQPYEIVGVLPPAFRLGLYEVDALVPVERQVVQPDSRTARALCVLGRLAPGASVDSAQAEMTTLARRLSASYPATNQHVGAEVISIQENALGYLRSFFLLLGIAVVLLLAITWANAASLMFTHFLQRSPDIAVRLSLGATRTDVARLLLVEGALAGLAAGMLAVALATAGVRLFVAYAPTGLPRADEVSVNARALGFLGILTVTMTAIAALLPLFRLRGDMGQHLRDAARTLVSSRSDSGFRGALTAIQVALTLVLLVGSTLVVSSLVHVTTIEPGFSPDGLLTFRVARPTQRLPGGDDREFYRRAFDALRSTPGLTGTAGVNNLPFTPTAEIQRVTADAAVDGAPQNASAAVVTPRYFATMGIPLVAGRDFTEQDGVGGPPVAIVNSTLARRAFGGSPIGAAVRIDTSNDPSSPPVTATIVGVVGDITQWNLLDAPDNQIYYPLGQPRVATMFAAVRTDAPEAAVSEARRALANIDRTVPIFDVAGMDDRIDGTLGDRRLNAALLQTFAMTSLVLAAFGLYATIRNAVIQRQKEIAVRKALGATTGSVYRLVLASALKLTAAGIVIGYGLTVVLGRVMLAALSGTTAYTNVLYGVSAASPLVLGLPLAAVLIVGLLAAYVPARRGARLDPVAALRE